MTKKLAPPTARLKLLDAAISVIRTKGYATTTVDDLCAAAKVTKGAFFHHFDSKEAMAVEAAQHWSDVSNAEFASAPYRRHADPLDRVLAYVDYRYAMVKGEVDEFTCFAGTLVQDNYATSPIIREACFKSIFGHAADVAADIEDAKKLHAPDAPWSAESLALHIQAVLQGAFILAKAKMNSDVALAPIAHLRLYIELLFTRS